MKVLDLRCEHGHGFEGWFASGQAFEDQLARGLVECPVCGTTSVAKLPAAPRLNLSGARAPGAAAAPASGAEGSTVPDSLDMRARWIGALRNLMARTENVGDRFAEEARRMHYGEVDERGIRGRATREEAEALLDEGIEVIALPMPPDPEGTLQ